ncbi:hypothetical protein ASC94_21245 [Massilia sp. Root418]|uniref:hypothetical protein n=1 Tax=Massilia sp. Root418 TaxID=1736532 RepID=UPI0007016571|nr:hypothetical protein [Massilia sp. Root418]KQW90251.1 hypothetical protein ASC94_21245 [Massilia sp. Root418]
MKPTRTFVAHPSNDQDGQQARQRRRFIKLMSAGAAGMALQACGGGGAAASAATTQGGPPPAEGVLPPSTASGGSSGPSALVPASTPPVWTAVPTLTFTQGVASTISISKYVKSASGGPLAIALNNIALPPGVTYNARTLSFVYDGIGAVGSTDGHVLTASDI